MRIALQRSWLSYTVLRPEWVNPDGRMADGGAGQVPAPPPPSPRWPGSERVTPPAWLTIFNKLLAKLRVPFMVVRRPDFRRDLATIEQMANLRLLADQVLTRGVPGAFVELGCYTGAASTVIGHALRAYKDHRPFHVYDRFDIQLSSLGSNVREIFETNMRDFGVPMPMVHQGDFHDTVPYALPERIAFAHVDCGIGDRPELHAALVVHCLNGLYPRLSEGAIVVLMDYHDANTTWHGTDVNPGVRLGCEEFFADKPERVLPLYGGVYSHGYFRKL